MSNPDLPLPYITVLLTITPQSADQTSCQRVVQSNGQPEDSALFYGQSHNHAIANALEHLAEQYRQTANDEQTDNWEAVEQLPNGDRIQKRYHVILHYEGIAEDESKFKAMHNTIVGNTVVENATIAVIEVDETLPLEPICRPWDY